MLKKFWEGIKSKFNFSIFKRKHKGFVVPIDKAEKAVTILTKAGIVVTPIENKMYFHLGSAIVGVMAVVVILLLGYAIGG